MSIRTFKQLGNAFKSSIKGLRVVVTERAFEQELIVSIPMILVMILNEFSYMEYVALILSMFIVLVVEVLNSAIETTIDRISMDYNELSGKAKDLGSAAVMLAIINVIIVWGIILYNNFVL